MDNLVTFETPDGSTYFHLTQTQKSKETVLFGPFAALGNTAAEKGVSYMTKNEEGSHATYWSIISENGGGACTPEVFQQFLHWILMQHLSKYTPHILVPPTHERPPLLSDFGEVISCAEYPPLPSVVCAHLCASQRRIILSLSIDTIADMRMRTYVLVYMYTFSPHVCIYIHTDNVYIYSRRVPGTPQCRVLQRNTKRGIKM